jgi:hypothetical protein
VKKNLKPVNLKDKVGAELPDPPYVTGGPAYPAHPSDANANIIGDGSYGLSILDYFAAQVINGLAGRQNMSLDDLKNDGPGTAYWVAAGMIDLRSRLPIELTPVPTAPEPPSDIPIVMPPPGMETAGTIHVTSAPPQIPETP